MTIFKKIFHRKPRGNDPEAEAAPQPLRIEGIPEAPFTPEPDDAELAAEAVLELMTRGGQNNRSTPSNKSSQNAPTAQTADYYRQLADRIREAHAKAARQATRFIYNCELELQKPRLPLYGPGSVQLLETELYKRIDVVDREGGELKTRWQYCLAEVTIRLMNTQPQEEKPHTDNTDNTEKKDGAQKTQKHAEGHS